MTKTYQKASGLINKPPAARLTRSSETFLDLWFHSVWLLWSAKSKQGWSHAGSQGFELYWGPPTGIVCQSESRLTSEGVCSLTRGGLLLSVIPLSERSWEEALVADCRADLWENGFDKRRQNNPVGFVLTSRPVFNFNFHVSWCFEGTKAVKTKGIN